MNFIFLTYVYEEAFRGFTKIRKNIKKLITKTAAKKQFFT
jgi:hypothetical protein